MIRRVSWLACVALAMAALVAIVYSPTPSAQGAIGVQPFNRCQVVTTSDTVNLPPFTQSGLLTGWIYVGGTGTMTVVAADGTTTLISAIPVGAQFPLAIKRINATGTSATLIVACFRV